MKKTREKLETLIPLEMLEHSAQQQIFNALELDFLLKLAIMPDCHTGYSLPIGGVALLDNVISPDYVGYDIGCGMCYIDTQLETSIFFKNQKDKEKIFDKIYSLIPVGFNSNEDPNPYDDFPNASGDKELYEKVISKLYIQLGTLGGGNHFIEIGENQKGHLTITIHSGSRNMGHSIASYYMKASKLGDSDLPQGFLHVNSELGQQYIQDMNFALEYALANRKRMMDEILFILGFRRRIPLMQSRMINENHNHAILSENGHVLHRKGATPAYIGQIGIIPGNMRDGVYVTEGLGNPQFLCSSSHGAGRKFSRKKAKESITLESFKAKMDGIVARVGQSTLDESPDAYKNLGEVISMQEGIVIKTIDHAKPIINVKG